MLVQEYRQGMENLPQWVCDFFEGEHEYGNDAEMERTFINEVLQHIDDEDICCVLKILISQSVDI